MDQPPSFTLRQLAYLVAATDHGSVAAAAQELHVSASAMANGIRELESAVGTPLAVSRRAHGLVPTAAGQLVVDRARQLLSEATEMHREALSPGLVTGRITVGCYPTLAPTVVPVLLDELLSVHAGLEVNVREAPQDVLWRELAQGGLDAVFGFETGLPDGLPNTRIMSLVPHVVVAAGHPLAAKAALRLDDLVDEPMIMLDSSPAAEHTQALFLANGLNPRVRHRSPSLEVVRTLVGRGLGYAILVQRHANTASAEGRELAARPLHPEPGPVGVALAWRPQRSVPGRITALAEFCAERWGTSPSPR